MGMKGLATNRNVHPTDDGIRNWSKQRDLSMQRAKEIRKQRAQTLDRGGGYKLPALTPADFGTTNYRSWEIGPLKLAPKKLEAVNKPKTASEVVLPPLLAAYPSATLAHLKI